MLPVAADAAAAAADVIESLPGRAFGRPGGEGGGDVPVELGAARAETPAGASGVAATFAVESRQPADAVVGGATLEEMAAPARELAPRLAETVQQAVRVGEREFRLRLNPPELGHLDVRVVESSDGVRVSLRVASSEAGELIQQYLPQLRAALEARDLRVERLDVFEAQTEMGGDGAPHKRTDGGDGEGQPRWSPLATPRQDEGGAPVERTGPGRLTSGVVDLMA